MTNAANKWIKKAFIKLRLEYGGKCHFCGSKINLVFAHRRKTPIIKDRPLKKAGRKERYYDIKRHPKAYFLTCRKHNKTAQGK
jgi:hypothetical protein